MAMNEPSDIITQEFNTSLEKLTNSYSEYLSTLKSSIDQKERFDFLLYQTYKTYKPLFRNTYATYIFLGKRLGLTFQRIQQIIKNVEKKGGDKS